MSIRCCYSWTPQLVKVRGGLLVEGVGRGLSVWLCSSSPATIPDSFYHCEKGIRFIDKVGGGLCRRMNSPQVKQLIVSNSDPMISMQKGPSSESVSR